MGGAHGSVPLSTPVNISTIARLMPPDQQIPRRVIAGHAQWGHGRDQDPSH
ncbi:hypothetical protein HMPREF1162_1818 [ [[Propionibacterium] namnetense SK182B-JCVI]|uniref:Uncharacterized protein n=1 Tax=[Propionibacterium] namnetense SK182B-JCVI TaxID=1051006 RepID=F9NW85_9ACTN|nr:hypothetical protein HMPREF1162_1818 [ [[Propionibacterium] namnetense SK182B-JCVI]